MKTEKLSILGYIFNFMEIRTTEIAKEIHVDPSLISKWRTGKRKFDKSTPSYDDVLKYIVNFGNENNFEKLKKCMKEIYPEKDTEDNESVLKCLEHALSGDEIKDDFIIFDNTKRLNSSVFFGNEGKRQAITLLFEFANKSTSPGNIIFADMEEFSWLLEDKEFSKKFSEELTNLLKKNYTATFLFQYSSSGEKFKKFFGLCSSILFNKNANWYYIKYYDKSFISFSMFLLKNRFCAVGVAKDDVSITNAFTDREVCLQNEILIDKMLEKSNALFKYYEPFEVPKILDSMPNLKKDITFYSYLPLPAFLSADKSLLEKILEDNAIEKNSEFFSNVMKINERFRRLLSIHTDFESMGFKKRVIIFQIEKMIERTRETEITSQSLTLCCGKKIVIKPEYYSTELYYIADELAKNTSLEVVLAYEDEIYPLPHINCWCMESNYALQMNSKGFRLCNESTAVSIITSALKDCIRKVPPERKDKNSVIEILKRH